MGQLVLVMRSSALPKVTGHGSCGASSSRRSVLSQRPWTHILTGFVFGKQVRYSGFDFCGLPSFYIRLQGAENTNVGRCFSLRLKIEVIFRRGPNQFGYRAEIAKGLLRHWPDNYGLLGHVWLSMPPLIKVVVAMS